MVFAEYSLIRNSTLGCFLISSFAKEYEEMSAGSALPNFEKILLVLPLVWHGPTRRAVARRNFATPLDSVIEECPAILDGFADRVSAHAAITAHSLNLACGSGLLKHSKSGGEFKFLNSTWPRGSRPVSLPKEQEATVSRLANWFWRTDAARIYMKLGVV